MHRVVSDYFLLLLYFSLVSPPPQVDTVFLIIGFVVLGLICCLTFYQVRPPPLAPLLNLELK